MSNKSSILKTVCELLLDNRRNEASVLARSEYPFTPNLSVGRKYTLLQSTLIFFRDGFVDRYDGKRLVFPGALKLLSKLLPEEFPAHSSWKMSESHIMYWELFPTIDHITPVARGGADDKSNWVTTSMINNGVKAHWTLEELNWQLRQPGDIEDWDGLMNWFLAYIEKEPTFLVDPYIKKWHRAALKASETFISNQEMEEATRRMAELETNPEIGITLKQSLKPLLHKT